MTRGIRSFRVPGVIPGIVPRLLIVAVVWAGALALVPFALWQWAAVIAALVSVAVPRSLTAWLAVACLVFGVILSEPAPERTALAVLLIPAIHLLASLCLVVPISSRFALAVLLPTLARFAVVQLLAQPVVFGMWLLLPGAVDRGLAWIAPLAAAVLLAGVLLALRAVKTADEPRGGRVPSARSSDAGARRGADVRGPS